MWPDLAQNGGILDMQTPDVEIPTPRERKSTARKLLKFLGTVVIVCVGGFVLLLLIAVGPQIVGDRNMLAKARVARAQGDIEGLKASLTSYQIAAYTLPTTEQGLQALLVKPADVSNWRGPYVEPSQLVDPWNKAYIYVQPGVRNPNGFDIYSVGPDGEFGTKDDIGNWETPAK
jgi:general secretion pathway protein G